MGIEAYVSKKNKKAYEEEIAEMLEEELDVIQAICKLARPYAPDYDVQAICKAYMENNKAVLILPLGAEEL